MIFLMRFWFGGPPIIAKPVGRNITILGVVKLYLTSNTRKPTCKPRDKYQADPSGNTTHWNFLSYVYLNDLHGPRTKHSLFLCFSLSWEILSLFTSLSRKALLMFKILCTLFMLIPKLRQILTMKIQLSKSVRKNRTAPLHSEST